jgi:hypothetical protein
MGGATYMKEMRSLYGVFGRDKLSRKGATWKR